MPKVFLLLTKEQKSNALHCCTLCTSSKLIVIFMRNSFINFSYPGIWSTASIRGLFTDYTFKWTYNIFPIRIPLSMFGEKILRSGNGFNNVVTYCLFRMSALTNFWETKVFRDGSLFTTNDLRVIPLFIKHKHKWIISSITTPSSNN